MLWKETRHSFDYVRVKTRNMPAELRDSLVLGFRCGEGRIEKLFLPLPKIRAASSRTLVTDETQATRRSRRAAEILWGDGEKAPEERVLMQAGSCVCLLLDLNFTGADAYWTLVKWKQLFRWDKGPLLSNARENAKHRRKGHGWNLVESADSQQVTERK